MTTRRILLSYCILLLFLPSVYSIPEAGKPSEISLPGEIGGWNRAAKPEVYEGEDLFLYINGGADIYHEYGFVRVTSAEYEKEGAGRISVELYRMKDPVSAFGIFSFRTGGKWGGTANLNLFSSDGYYLNLLAGNHLITITSININKETGLGIHEIRKILEEKITIRPVIPNIVKKIHSGKYPIRVYFEGDMGMMNSYNLFSASSGILRGVAGSGREGQVILLEFPSLKDPPGKIKTLAQLLKREGRYSDFISERAGIRLSDQKKNQLYITKVGEYIAVFIERDLRKCLASAEQLKKFIRPLGQGPRPLDKN